MFISLHRTGPCAEGVLVRARDIRKVTEQWGARLVFLDGEEYPIVVGNPYQEIVDMIGQVPPEDLR